MSALSCRLSSLPNHLYYLLHLRLASTTASNSSKLHNPYPFPSHARPTPHQIFHLPLNASQEDIKARYYDLVRVHHPDSSHSQLHSSAERHKRFQSITAAYEVLRGKSSPAHSGVDPYREEVLRRKQFYQAHHSRRAEYMHPGQEWAASPDDRWKDKLIIIVGLLTLAVGVIPGVFMLPDKFEQRHRAAASSLSQARSEARELGEDRRNEVRKRVKDIKMQESDGHARGSGVDDRLKEPEDPR